MDVSEDIALGDALVAYFRRNHLPVDGGYTRKSYTIRTWPVRLRLPNTASHVAAVKMHDLHHLLTGYRTDWCGEGEMAAWELASGTPRPFIAFALDFLAVAAMVFRAPRRLFVAFHKGTAAKNFYGRDYDTLLNFKIRDARSALKREHPGSVAVSVLKFGILLCAIALFYASALALALIAVAVAYIFFAHFAR